MSFPRDFFRRYDEADDGEFYQLPRFVTHIDDATIAALTQVYRELIAPGAAVLDLMSSWISHLPPEASYARVAGVGMNREELARNPQLTNVVVQDLNTNPLLPYAPGTFDAVVNAVSIQYLTRPVEVYAEVIRVLNPGGVALVAISHRMFPTKAVAVWQTLDMAERARLVGTYLEHAGGWEPPQYLDRSPANADPLWVVCARRPC